MKNSRKLFVFLISIASLFTACNAASEKNGAGQVPVSHETSDSIPVIQVPTDTTSWQLPPDSTHGMPAPSPVPTVLPREVQMPASMAYHYPISIRQNQVRNVFVHVRAKATRQQVAQDLKAIIKSVKQDVKEDDTNNVLTIDIPLYSNLTVSLLDPGKDFDIDTVHIADRQMVDTADGNKWHWTIKTTTHKKEGRLIIRVVTDNLQSGDPIFVDGRDIPIRIRFEPWHRKFLDWLNNNPGYVTSSILVPLATFIGARWFKRKRRRRQTERNGQ